ncbi:ABC transporter permease [ANME-2 cluster archaeon]|nr:ABC transporter permease [Methanosarcinales archaeon]RJS69323.1 MAG: ABC transporter permease [ANME-2 cluster archaeon]
MTLISRRYVVEIVSLLCCIVIWQLAADYVVRDAFILPSFSDVLASFYHLWHDMIYDAEISLLHFGIGMAAGMGVAIPLGISMGWFRIIDRIFDPIVEIIRPIAPLAWIPFAIVWLGITHWSAGFIVFIGAVFPILINTYAGFREVPKILIEAAMVLGCTKDHDLIRRVAFPSAVPRILTGIRIGMGVAWMCVVAAEMFGMTCGIGYKIPHWANFHRMDHVMAYMLLLGFIALFIDKAFRYFVEQRLCRWRRGIMA